MLDIADRIHSASAGVRDSHAREVLFVSRVAVLLLSDPIVPMSGLSQSEVGSIAQKKKVR